MSEPLFVASESGLFILEEKSGEWIQNQALTDQRLTSISAHGDQLICGTRNGLLLSNDRGISWQDANDGLTTLHIRWLTHHPQEKLLFAGTEPAGIFVSDDDAQTWEEKPEITDLREQFSWFLPYSPEMGCVRGFSANGSRIYAAAEVGGALRSDDFGNTWQLAKGSDGRPRFGRPAQSHVHPDVHSIHVHPSSPELVFAPTGGGLYFSVDGGAAWELNYACYCRAAWIDPMDPDHILFGPADNVDQNGRIEETIDGGSTWKIVGSILNPPWSRHMVERLHQSTNFLFAVLSNGELLHSPLGEDNWKVLDPELRGVSAIASDFTEDYDS